MKKKNDVKIVQFDENERLISKDSLLNDSECLDYNTEEVNQIISIDLISQIKEETTAINEEPLPLL